MPRSDSEQWQFITHKAALMRMNPTPAERKAVELLARLGFNNQFPIKAPKHRGTRYDFYILDLYCPRAWLCIELDGSVHGKTKGRDGRRDRALAMMGIKTLRFPNGDVLRKPAEFTARVVREIAARTKGATIDAVQGG